MNKILIAAAALLAGLAIGAGPAAAQYPEPTGSLTLTSDATVASSGSQAQISCILRDLAGNPIAGAECTLAIVEEPGDDASIGSKVTTKVTDANGIATVTLHVGSTPGLVVVSATSGEFAATVVVSVGAPPPAVPVLPPAAPISPPTTGDGGFRR